LTRGGQWIATSIVEVAAPQQQRIGIVAYGSLIDDPATRFSPPRAFLLQTSKLADIKTPFRVEFARRSSTRAGAPTLVPGAQVPARIFVLRPEISEQAAKDMLWRRETRTNDPAGAT
jgi:hypothetical protein